MLELKTTAWALCETRETQDLPKTISQDKAAEIAAEFMTTFYHVQIGALETQEFRTQPVPFWLVCFSDSIKRGLRQFPLPFNGKRWVPPSLDSQRPVCIFINSAKILLAISLTTSSAAPPPTFSSVVLVFLGKLSLMPATASFLFRKMLNPNSLSRHHILVDLASPL